MKKIFAFVVFSLLSCQGYEQPSNPQLNLNGRWDVVDINVVIDNVYFESQIIVINETQASVSNFIIAGITEDGLLKLTQDYKSTIINRRFDINYTKWEFDYYNLAIQDQYSSERLWVDFPCSYCNEHNIIETDYNGDKTRYTFSIDTYGAMPSNVLKLTSQSFFTSFVLDGIPYNNAIESHLEITLHRI